MTVLSLMVFRDLYNIGEALTGLSDSDWHTNQLNSVHK